MGEKYRQNILCVFTNKCQRTGKNKEREKLNKTDNRTGGRKLLDYVAKISQISQLHTTLKGSSHRLII